MRATAQATPQKGRRAARRNDGGSLKPRTESSHQPAAHLPWRHRRGRKHPAPPGTQAPSHGRNRVGDLEKDAPAPHGRSRGRGRAGRNPPGDPTRQRPGAQPRKKRKLKQGARPHTAAAEGAAARKRRPAPHGSKPRARLRGKKKVMIVQDAAETSEAEPERTAGNASQYKKSQRGGLLQRSKTDKTNTAKTEERRS